MRSCRTQFTSAGDTRACRNGRALPQSPTALLTASRNILHAPDAEAEVRCTVDGEIVQSQADSSFLVLLEFADEWKRQFQERSGT